MRASRPLIFRSSGPMPWSGDSAPISTWYTPLNSRVFSTADDVLRLFDDADDPRGRARRSLQKRARIGVGDVVADRAVGDALLDVAHRLDEASACSRGRLEDVKREALRALGPDAGQALQLFDEADEGSGKDVTKSKGKSQKEGKRKVRKARQKRKETVLALAQSFSPESCRPSSAPSPRRPCAGRR